MKRLYLTVLACLFIGYCFPQSTVNPGSIDNNIIVTPSTKESADISSATVKPVLGLFPNPARNKVSLQVNGFERGMATVKIIDMKGNSFREENRLLISGNEDVAMYFMLPPGVYFVIIRQKEKLARKKLVIN